MKKKYKISVHECDDTTVIEKELTQQEFWNYKEPLKVIEDLVNRDTPKKPLLVEVSTDNEYHFVCSHCNETINIGSSKGYNKVFNVFCRVCGQRLDWS